MMIRHKLQDLPSRVLHSPPLPKSISLVYWLEVNTTSRYVFAVLDTFYNCIFVFHIDEKMYYACPPEIQAYLDF